MSIGTVEFKVRITDDSEQLTTKEIWEGFEKVKRVQGLE